MLQEHFQNPSTIVVFGFLILGLGLFFIGASYLATGLKSLAGPRMRSALSKLDHRPVTSASVGVVFGGVAQSTSLASFIMSNMVSAEMIGLKAAMLVVLWSNVGPSLLVFLATLPMNIITAYLLGLVGAGYYLGLQKSTKYRSWLLAVLGLALLLLGITHTKTASEWMGHWVIFEDLLSFGHDYGPILFVFSIFLAFIARSSAAVTVIVIAFASTGTINVIDGIIMILGANLGTGLISLELARDMQGPAKQLMVFQCVAKVIGFVLWLFIITMDAVLGTYYIRNFVHLFTDNLAVHLAIEYLLIQLATAFGTLPLIPFIQRRLAEKFPEPKEVELGRPKFINPSAMSEPNSALWLIVRERLRIWSRIPDYLDVFLTEKQDEVLTPALLHEANRKVMETSQAYVVELIEHGTNWQVLQRGVNMERGYESLMALDSAVYDLVLHKQNYLRRFPKSLAVRRYLEAEALELKQAIPRVVNVFKRFDLDEINDYMQALRDDHPKIDQRVKAYLDGQRGYIDDRDRYAIVDTASRLHRIYWLVYRMLTIAKIRVAWEQGEKLTDEELTLSAVYETETECDSCLEKQDAETIYTDSEGNLDKPQQTPASMDVVAPSEDTNSSPRRPLRPTRYFRRGLRRRFHTPRRRGHFRYPPTQNLGEGI